MAKYYWNNLESALTPERTQYFKTQNGDLFKNVQKWLRSGCILHKPLVIYIGHISPLTQCLCWLLGAPKEQHTNSTPTVVT